MTRKAGIRESQMYKNRLSSLLLVQTQTGNPSKLAMLLHNFLCKPLFVVLALFGFSLIVTPAMAVTPPEPLTTSPMSAKADWNHVLDASSDLWLAYYDDKRLLRLRAPDGTERPLAPPGRPQAPSGLAMGRADDNVALLWRDKVPTKGLYMMTSAQTIDQAIELGGDTQPLAAIAAAGSPGQLHTIWMGEKAIANRKSPYYFYYRGIDLKTNELTPIMPVVPGIYPVMAHRDNGDLMVFGWDTGVSPQRIVARYRAGDADAFADSVEVASLDGASSITPLFRGFRNGDRWFVLWHALYGRNQASMRIEGAYSDDDGKTWNRFEFQDLRGFDIGSLSVAMDQHQHIVLAMSGILLKDANSKRHTMHLMRSTDNGATWKATPPLRPDPKLRRFAAKHPVVTFGSKPGELLVAWEDWREIRSRLYASLSLDAGESWAYDNVPLPREPKTNLGLRFDSQAAFAQDDQFNIIAEQALDDSFTAKRIVLVRFSKADLKALLHPNGDQTSGSDPESAVKAAAQDTAASDSDAASSTGDIRTATINSDGEQTNTSPDSASALPANVKTDAQAPDEKTTQSADTKPESESTTPKPASEQALRKRIHDFWKAMIAAEHDIVYTFYDPFYRAKNSWLLYRSNVGRIEYDSYQIHDVQIDGPVAKVKLTTKATVPPFRARSTGEVLSLPQREVPLTDTWLWIDDNWYREYYSESQDKKYTRYQ
jgi:hypothetical protein